MNELEIIKSITFYGFALAIVVFALLTLFARRILYSLLFAVILFFCTGGIFFSLGADYSAVVQIIIYGVAIPVLLLFAIMFTSAYESRKVNLSYSPRFFVGFLSASLLFMMLWYAVQFALGLSDKLGWFFNSDMPKTNSVEMFMAMSNGIYTNYSLPFILIGLLVLFVVVGISTLSVIKEKKHVK